MKIKGAKQEERLFFFANPEDIWKKAGFIGYLRGDFGRSGREWWHTFFDFDPERKTELFITAFDRVINDLRLTAGNGAVLKNMEAMKAYCMQHPQTILLSGDFPQHGFRIDVDGYALLLRCNPVLGDYHFYCYCYNASKLDKHIGQAKKGITFTDEHGTPLFTLPDGGAIRVSDRSGKSQRMWCRYFDDTQAIISKVAAKDERISLVRFAKQMGQIQCAYEPWKN